MEKRKVVSLPSRQSVFPNKIRWINSRKIYDRNECLRERKRVAINAIGVLVGIEKGEKWRIISRGDKNVIKDGRQTKMSFRVARACREISS